MLSMWALTCMILTSDHPTHPARFIYRLRPFQGWTVGQTFATAELELGGCSTTYNISDLNDAADAINNNFDDGTVSGNFLICSCTPPNANAGLDKSIGCISASTVQLSGSSTTTGVTFSWTASNGGNIVSGGNTATPTVNAAGTYILTVTIAAGCTATDAVIVTALQAPTCNISITSCHLNHQHCNCTLNHQHCNSEHCTLNHQHCNCTLNSCALLHTQYINVPGKIIRIAMKFLNHTHCTSTNCTLHHTHCQCKL